MTKFPKDSEWGKPTKAKHSKIVDEADKYKRQKDYVKKLKQDESKYSKYLQKRRDSKKARKGRLYIEQSEKKKEDDSQSCKLSQYARGLHQNFKSKVSLYQDRAAAFNTKLIEYRRQAEILRETFQATVMAFVAYQEVEWGILHPTASHALYQRSWLEFELYNFRQQQRKELNPELQQIRIKMQRYMNDSKDCKVLEDEEIRETRKQLIDHFTDQWFFMPAEPKVPLYIWKGIKTRESDPRRQEALGLYQEQLKAHVADKVAELDKVFKIADARVQSHIKTVDFKIASLDAKMVQISDLDKRMDQLTKGYRRKTEGGDDAST